MELLIGALIGVLLLTIGLLFMGQSQKSRAPKQGAISGAFPADFTPTIEYVDNYGGNGIAVDASQRVCLLDSEKHMPRIVAPRDILVTEVLQNGTSIAKTMRTSEQGKMFIARLQDGETAALVAHHPEQPSTENEKHIVLRVVVNDCKHPTHMVTFLNMEAKEDGFIYQQAASQVTHWQKIISQLIKQADSEDCAVPIQQLSATPVAQPD